MPSPIWFQGGYGQRSSLHDYLEDLSEAAPGLRGWYRAPGAPVSDTGSCWPAASLCGSSSSHILSFGFSESWPGMCVPCDKGHSLPLRTTRIIEWEVGRDRCRSQSVLRGSSLSLLPLASHPTFVPHSPPRWPTTLSGTTSNAGFSVSSHNCFNTMTNLKFHILLVPDQTITNPETMFQREKKDSLLSNLKIRLHDTACLYTD